jgi:hypothetical protein
MAGQMKKVHKKEAAPGLSSGVKPGDTVSRTTYGSHMPTKSDLSAIRKGRAEISQGHYAALQELLRDLDHLPRKTGRKAARKSSS